MLQAGDDTPPLGSPADWLARQATRWPGAPAVELTHGTLGYGELNRLAGGVGRRLRQVLPRGGVVAAALPAPWQTALGLYACLSTRLPFLVLDHRQERPERDALCASVGPCLLLGGRSADGGSDAVRERFLGAADRVKMPGSGPESHPALLLPTSGSTTGRPKVVMLSAANLASAVRGAGARIPLGPGDRWLACLPVHHVGGLAILLRCLAHGATTVLHGGFEPTRVWRDLVQRRITHLSLVPAMLHRLLEVATGSAPTGLRVVLVGGAVLDPGLARRARRRGWPLCVSYGLSEAGSQVATLCGPEAGLESGRVGRPLEGLEIRIASADAAGVGRIQIRGESVMSGYATPGLAPGNGLKDGWFDTGDLGHLDPEQGLRVLGRSDDTLSSGGEKVHPSQVEPVLRRCPGVRDAALSALADPVWGDLLVAAYLGDAEPADMEAYCRRKLQGVLRPRVFIRLRTMPMGRTGKLDRRRLRWLVAEAHREGP